MQNVIHWIEDWFEKQCNGDWEHSNRIIIESSDNPGWIVRIDLTNTSIEKLNIEYALFEKNESDWYGFSLKNAVYSGVGDPKKLDFLLKKFKQLIDEG